MKKRKFFLIFFGSIIFFVCITVIVFLFVWSRNSYKIIQKEKNGIYTIVLYQMDPGARGSATVNLSIGLKPNLNKRGNIYSAVIPEDTLDYYVLDKDSKKIDFYIRDDSVQLNARNEYKNFKIVYHISDNRK
ncbi:MAG: hypothetical protein K6A89_01590 [Treponema sp.]|nr:hypothetical protein [Treponema sp.]